MAVQFVLDDFTVQSVAVDTKDLGRLGLISTGLGEGVLNESFFELIESFTQINPAFNHLCHQGFQLLFHNFSLDWTLPPPALQRTVAD